MAKRDKPRWEQRKKERMKRRVFLLLLFAVLAGCTSSGTFRQGVMHDRKGEHEQAVRCYSRAVRTDPDLADAYFNRGIDYSRMGEHARAIEDYEAVLRIDPEDARAHNNMGVALAAIGETNLAVRHFSLALEIDPGYADAHYNLGNAHSSLGNPDFAIEEYSRVLEIDPEHAEAYHNRAVAFAKMGDTVRSADDLTKAMEIYQRVFPLYDRKLAHASFNRGLVSEARMEFGRAELDFSRACRLGYPPGCDGASRVRAKIEGKDP